MKLVIATTLWRRHNIERSMLRRFAAIRDDVSARHDVRLIAIGSEGDASRHRAEAHGWEYHEHPNEPLGAKHNAMARAAQRCRPDAFMPVGSDNWTTSGLVDALASRFEAGATLSGLRDVYFVEPATGRAGRFAGYARGSKRFGEPIGPCRMLGAKALDAVSWRPWSDALSRNLDGSMTARLAAAGYSAWLCASCQELGTVCIDWKTETNLWSFTHMARHLVPTDLSRLLARFPTAEVAALRKDYPALPEPEPPGARG